MILVITSSRVLPVSANAMPALAAAANGILDPDFGTGGKVLTDFGSSDDAIEAVAIQPEGKIVVADVSTVNGGTSIALQSDGKIVVAGHNYANFAVARYSSNGSPDTTFYNVGHAILEDFGSDLGGDAVLQPDGKIIVVGGSWHDTNYTNYDFALARFSGVAPPGAVTKISPVDASSDIDLSATLSWGSSASASSCQYCYDMIDDDQCNRTWTSASATSS